MQRIVKFAALWLVLLLGVANAQTSRIPVGPALNGQSAIANGSAGGGIGGSTKNACGATDHICNVVNFGADVTGLTDSTTAIQKTVNAACAAGASTTNTPEVYLPATPGSGCYLISSPILLNCTHLKFNGGGWQQTQFCQNYYGPTLIAQAAETGWKPPLSSSITVPWQATHVYAQYKEIVDSNGNVEVATTAGTSGSSAPSWPGSNGGTVVDGGTLTWTRALTGTTNGTGNGWLDCASPEMWPGAGFGSNNCQLELSNPADLESQINGLSTFTIEFFVSELATFSSQEIDLARYGVGFPGATGGIDAFNIQLNSANGACTGNCLRFIFNLGGSAVTAFSNLAAGSVAVGVPVPIAITYDGTTLRGYVNGVLAASNTGSGNLTVLPYESLLLGSTAPQVYPGLDGGLSLEPSYFSSLRISNTARYTGSTYTPPTTAFGWDPNTVALFNFPTSGVPTGTTEGFVGGGEKAAFVPIETSDGGALLDPIYIGNMQLADNGIYANWMDNSTIQNIWQGGAGRTCMNLHDNDYQDEILRAFCGIVPAPKTNVGFIFGNQSNDNLYNHLQCDGQYTCIEQVSGSGHYILPDYSDRGYAIAPVAFYEAQAVLDSLELDIEDSAMNETAGILSQGAYAPILVRGGQLPSGSSGTSALAINGGAPIIAQGVSFGGTYLNLLDVLGAPTAPVQIDSSTLPTYTNRTNSGNGQYLVITQHNTPEKVLLPNLWTCATVNTGVPLLATDTNICTFYAAYTSSSTTGSSPCVLTCDGTNWRAQ
jgi:Concanavalin A-like lectin/glucanases superfamily/Pectate lyase superfamily protein